MEFVARPFGAQDFVADHPVLDLVNTVAGRDPARVAIACVAGDGAPGHALDAAQGRDRLSNFGWAIAWAAARREAVAPEPGEPELLGPAEQMELERLATRDPAAATLELQRLVALREAVFDLVAARSRGYEVPAAVLDAIMDPWKDAAYRAILGTSSEQYDVIWTAEKSGVALLRHRVAWQAMDLVTGDDLRRAHLCAGDDCGWVFLDRSKAGRRRWCDMATCGNVAKARRHYERQRGGRGARGASE